MAIKNLNPVEARALSVNAAVRLLEVLQEHYDEHTVPARFLLHARLPLSWACFREFVENALVESRQNARKSSTPWEKARLWLGSQAVRRSQAAILAELGY